jgi:uncharacterized protein (DUF2132 family)
MSNQELNDPLHGKTLEFILTNLVDFYGYEKLAERIKIACFINDPSIKSSLRFLRRNQWARVKIEKLYIATLKLSKQGRKD